MDKSSILNIRIYYEDTDCGGVVYYANYLKYMERGRTEYLRERGISITDWHKQNVYFAVVETNVKYHAPARYGDMLKIVTTLDKLSHASMIFRTEMYRDSVLLNTSMTRLASVDNNMKPFRIPDVIIKKL